MRKSTSLSRLLLVFCMPLVWSCAAHQSDSTQSQLTSDTSFARGQFSSPAASEAASSQEKSPESGALSSNQDDDLSPTESEATARQEITDLKKLGTWDEQGKHTPDLDALHSDFPLVLNPQVEYYINLFQNQQRKIFASWLTRSGRYVPMMRQRLAEAGLPQDLVYLSMIESGFKPNAFSTASAVGLWQFMEPSAKRFGLQVNSYVDERRDPVLSTKAAIAYLHDLHSQFDNWYMAIAAYNAGEGRISNGLKKYNCKNFWDLAEEDYLALETKRYVPQLIAAIIIAKSPKAYGFDDIQYEKPQVYETASVPTGTTLAAVAVATNTDAEVLHDLNRQLSKGVVPPGVSNYELKLPVGSAHLVAANLPRVHATVSTQFKDHVIGAKDTITQICAKYSINKITLLKANNLHKAKLVPGNILRIPYQTTQYALLSDKDLKQLADSAKKPEDVMVHTVKAGETLEQIASRYGTSDKKIAGWNKLTAKQRLKAGQQLTLFVEDEPMEAKGADKKLVAKASGGKAVVAKEKGAVGKGPAEKGKDLTIVATKTKTPAPKTPEPTLYQVKSGDSLWAIAERFNLDPADLKKWNKLESNAISPGLTLIIKSKS